MDGNGGMSNYDFEDFSIDPAYMLRVANSIDGQRVIIGNCLNSIQEDAAALTSEWEGESSAAYQAGMAKLGQVSPMVESILNEYIQSLNQIASKFISDEQKIISQSESLPSDIFNDI
jgi:WXG100 family type VII secretion target